MGERGGGGCHIQIPESTLVEKVTVGERGGGGCHIQIPESTLVQKVTVWVKGVGWLSHTDTRKYTGAEGHCVGERGGVAVTYRYQKVHWWRQRYVTMRTKGVSGMGCFLKTQARKVPVSIRQYTGGDIGFVTMWMRGGGGAVY